MKSFDYFGSNKKTSHVFVLFFLTLNFTSHLAHLKNDFRCGKSSLTQPEKGQVTIRGCICKDNNKNLMYEIQQFPAGHIIF